MRVRPSEPVHRDIVLLAIDDRSLQALGPWPWHRRIHGELTHHLKQAGAKAIFFDMLFPEHAPDPEDDRLFSQAIGAAGNVVLPFHYVSKKPFDPLFPIPEFQKEMREMGYANIEIDPKDGVVRQMIPFNQLGGKVYAHSSIALYLSLFERQKDREDWVRSFSKKFHDHLLINYAGGMEQFQRISAGEVIERAKTKEGQEFLKQAFDGKIVLIGHVATGTTDLRATPIDSTMPGLVIQASILNTILSGRYLTELPILWNFFIAFLLAWMTAWMGQKLRPSWTVIATLSQMVLYTVANCLIFNYFRFVVYLPMPLVAMFVTFIVSLFMRYGDVRMEMTFLARELEMASKIQQTLLPMTELKLAQLDAGFRCLFFEQVGGDFYDWLDLGNGRVALCLGDVSGKGVPAALYMARALNELRHQVTSGAAPGEILTALNSHLAKGETAGMFLTLFFVLVDSTKKKIYFANAGHDPMVYFSSAQNQAKLITHAGGLPIGIMEDQVFETGEINFETGDVLMLTSDGIKEQKSSRGEMYGSERLQKCVEICARNMDSGKIIDAVMGDVLKFANGQKPHDDRTLVCAKMLQVLF